MRTVTVGRRLLVWALVPFLWGCALHGPAGAVPSYRIDLDVDWQSGTFAGTAVLTFENETTVPLDHVDLNLFANDASIYGAARLDVLDVSVGEIQTLSVVQSNPTRLSVRLPAPLEPGQTASLATRFRGSAAPSPETSGHAASGYGVLTKNRTSFVLTAFYPILAVPEGSGPEATCGVGDRLWSESSDYTVTVRTAEPVDAAATGRLVSADWQDGRTVHRFEAAAARDFSIVLTRGYEEGEIQTGGMTIRSHFSSDSREASSRTLELAYESLLLYESLIGPLPIQEIEIVEVPLQRVAGVEFDGLILVSASYARAPSDPFYDIIVSHEMAHEWFYAAVGNDPVAEPWLDEGLATFLSNEFLAEVRGTSTATSERTRWSTSYDAARAGTPALSIALPSCAYPTSSSYSTFAYGGAAWFLHNVREEIGADAFFGALSAYYATHVGRIASGDDLLAAFRAACDCSLDPLYESFGFASP